MTKRQRRHGSRKLRSRPTPKWLLKAEDLDKIAQQRCLLVLSVLSGETPVTEAISAAGMSRAAYYQLETRALSAMLRALGPLATEEGTESSPLRQIAALEAKVRELERSRRRTQRLLLMTRRVVLGKEKRIGSTRPGSAPSKASKRKKTAKALPPSRPLPPTTTGEGAP